MQKLGQVPSPLKPSWASLVPLHPYYKVMYPKRDSIPILFHFGYQTIKMLSYIVQEALAEIYELRIIVLKLPLCIPFSAFQNASKELQVHSLLLRPGTIGWFMKIAVSVTQDTHDLSYVLACNCTAPDTVSGHRGTKIFWRNSTCTNAATHHLH